MSAAANDPCPPPPPTVAFAVAETRPGLLVPANGNRPRDRRLYAVFTANGRNRIEN